MKFWIEAELQNMDIGVKQCAKCRVWSREPQHIFVEFQLLSGTNPNPQELHLEPTGQTLCATCAKKSLI